MVRSKDFAKFENKVQKLTTTADPLSLKLGSGTNLANYFFTVNGSK
jgi:hypothetical protein